MPILTYAATSPYLSSKDDYPSVWRTCLNDAVQTQAWTDLCVRFSWKNVIVLVESTAYSIGAADYFIVAANRAGVSVKTIYLDNGASTNQPRIREAMKEIRKSGIKIIFAPVLTLVEALLDTAVEERMFGKASFVRREEDWTIKVNKTYPAQQRTSTYKITLPKNVRHGDSRVQGYVWNFVDSVSGIMNVKYASLAEGSLGFNEPMAEFLAVFDRPSYNHHLENAFNDIRDIFRALKNSSSLHGSSLESSSRNRQNVEVSSGENDLVLDTELTKEEESMLASAKRARFASYPMSMTRALFAICDIVEKYWHIEGRFPDANEMVSLMRTYRKENSFGSVFSFDTEQEYTAGQMVLINARKEDYLYVVAMWSNLTGFEELKDDMMLWPDGSSRVPDDGIALEDYIFCVSILNKF